MNCERCKSQCFINEWNGWIWECPFCGKENRKATDEEVAEWERVRDLKTDIESVIRFLEGDAEKEKVVNFIKMYILPKI